MWLRNHVRILFWIAREILLKKNYNSRKMCACDWGNISSFSVGNDFALWVTFWNPAVQLASHTSKTFIKVSWGKPKTQWRHKLRTLHHIKKYFQILKEYIVIWFHAGLSYWAIPNSLSKPQWLPKNGQISRDNDYSLDMLFVNIFKCYFWCVHPVIVLGQHLTWCTGKW